MPVRLVICICHPLLLVSCNDRRGVAYATTLTQALLQVLASYSMQRFFQFPRLNSHSHALNSHSHPIPIPWLILLPFPWESHGTNGIPVFPIPMHTSCVLGRIVPWSVCICVLGISVSQNGQTHIHIQDRLLYLDQQNIWQMFSCH